MTTRELAKEIFDLTEELRLMAKIMRLEKEENLLDYWENKIIEAKRSNPKADRIKLYTEEQVEKLLKEQRRICEDVADWLSYPDTKFFVDGRIRNAHQPDLPDLTESDSLPDCEYEMFFKSEPTDKVKIDGWYPIATDRIRHPGRIEKYIANGLLRKINA